MKSRFGILVMLAAFAVAPILHAQINEKETESKERHDARMQWWRAAKFGMFIHWGVYAVPAGFYHDKPVGGIGEWIMNRGKIPMSEYQQFAKDFNPVKFDADQWVKIAKDAGMNYIVITSKHHDGFAMYPSKVCKWNLTDATPFKRDPLKELAEACRKHGIRLGFYYSQAQDWNNGGAGNGWDPANKHDMDDYIDKIAVPQIKEICSNYGPDVPAVLWWDTPQNMNRGRAEKLYDAVKELKPDIIMNNRLGGGFKGDTETPEQHIPAQGFPGRDWETCMTMNGTWGYKRDDNNWKPVSTLIRNLCDIASKGGNYLLNVGPTAEGLIPEPSVERLAEVGRWMKVNGEAIYGTAATPFKKLSWGRCTTRRLEDGSMLYLMVFDWPKNGKLIVPGLKNKIVSAKMLSDGSALETVSAENGVMVSLPPAAPDPVCSVIKMQVQGIPEIEPTRVTQNPDGSFELKPADAELHGGQMVQGGEADQNIGYWTNPSDWAEWHIQITSPGIFIVSAETSSIKGGSLVLETDEEKLKADIPATGDYNKFSKAELGKITIRKNGEALFSVRPVAEGWNPVNLGTIRCTPEK